MTSLVEKLGIIVGQAFAANDLPEELGRIKVSDRPDLCQFQCNGAMAAAKIARKNPREVAGTVLEALKDRTELSHLDIAGPGFINLNVADDYLAAHLKEINRDERLGIPGSGEGIAILDYGGPNVAKAMHVGHLRASIIGDTLRRVMSFAGYEALGDVHMGDWGTQMGMIISALEIEHPDWPYFDPAIEDDYPDEPPVTLTDLEKIYPAAAAACKADEARMEKARQATVDLQEGRAGYRALWRHFMTVSIAGMKKNFDALDVHFDLWKGESDVQDLIMPMVEELKAQHYAVKD